jgi:uncharacterized sulfatase
MMVTLLIPLMLAASSASAARPPNIVILFADDLGYGDLSSYGHPYIRTPNLDRLAQEGQRWTDFYAPAPVCSPSRGALLTGRLPNRTGLYGRQIRVLHPDDVEGMPEQEYTMAEALRDAGYATGMIGKWHLGDAPDKLPTRHGFDYWYGVPYSNDMDWTNEPTLEESLRLRATRTPAENQALVEDRLRKWLNPKNEYWNVPVLRSRYRDQDFEDEVVQRPAIQKNLTKNYTREAVAFIERSRAQPFLLYVPYSMPHTPIFRSDAFVDTSLAGRYGDVIEELDWSVGAIVDKLVALGLAQNTLLVFTSDNGPWLWMRTHGGSAGPFANGKGTTFEGGMRVPAIFWWPGTIKPGVVSGIGSAMDLYNTALALAGADASRGVDGFDLTETLSGQAASPRELLFYYRAGDLYAVRKGRYKLSFVSEGAYGMPPDRVEHTAPVLYDLQTDPGERFDIARQHPAVVADMLREVERHRAGLDTRPPLFDKRLARLRAE